MSGWSGTIPEQLYTYVQTSKPTGAEEGESWYDLDGDKAYVFVDGQGSTTELTLDDHAQLAGIGPADHHNPVTVSTPLTRSGQALGIALGNALTESNGSLAVSESAISLSNLSGYPVGTGDLGFDTATQSELDSHESDTNAHHGRPTQTQSDKQTTGRHSGYQWSRVAVDGYDPEDYWTPLTGVFAEVNLKNNDGSAHDAHIRYADGSSKTVTVSANSNQWISVAEKPLAGVGLTNQYQFVYGYNQVLHGSHSHQI